MPNNEISLTEIKSILVSNNIFSKDDPKLDTVVKLISDYLKTLVKPVSVTSLKPSVDKKSATFKPRNPKEEAVMNVYRLVLGREPSVNDLAYLSSLNIPEEVLMRKMIDSLEHAEIVKARQEVIASRVLYNAMKVKLEEITANLKDRESILSNLQKILEEKNSSYEELHKKHAEVSERLDNIMSMREEVNNTSLVDRILDWFNKKFG